jgi:hypothetical protein
VELRSCGFVSPAGQALGACTHRAEIIQVCAGLEDVASKAEIMQGWGAQSSETELLQDCAGLGGVYWQTRDHTGLCRPEGGGVAW